MRRKILFVALTAVLLAVTVFGVPLAVLIARNVTAQERSEIERLGLRAAIQLSPRAFAGGAVDLPGGTDADPVGVYDARGRLVRGTGPARLEAELEPALHGQIAQESSDSALLVAVPVSRADHVIGVVRVSTSMSEVEGQVHRDWAVLALLGVAAAGAAGAIAMVQSRRLARPLIQLEEVATELGQGNLGARAPVSGVAEIDRASLALNATAGRLGALIAREQAFSAHASHQLRTPLTGLRLQLEAGLEADSDGLREAARSAIRSADELSRTIDDVLSLTRMGVSHGPTLPIADLLTELERRWSGLLEAAGRGIQVEADDPPAGTASAAAVRQVLDILVDNAYRHGRGTVTVVARGSGEMLAVDVIDEGEAPPLLPPTGDGLGLSLALETVAGQNGRIVQATGEQRTRLTLLLPGEPSGRVADSRSGRHG